MPATLPLPRCAVLLACLAGAAAPTHALEQDRNLPFQIKATAVDLDQKTGSATYRGNVVISQGSMRIEAERVDIQMDKRRPTTVTATGKPVYLRALLEDQDDELQAHAQRIVYRADQRSIELSGNAWVRQGEDEVRAEILTYDLDRQRLRASGAEAGAPGGDGRVYAIFHPKAKDEKP